MKLKTVSLKNFRGYQSETLVPIEGGMTGIVGRNDYGKSTILEALGIFFASDCVKPDKNDLNCFCGESHFEIACVFDDLPDVLVLDESSETSLRDEYLLNQDGDLEIVKSFKGSTGKIDSCSIRCSHPANELGKDLLGLKIKDLKARGEELGIGGAVADKRVAAQWREAIRRQIGNLELMETLVNVDKDLSADSKAIWAKIEAYLPRFALFKADRESSDGDPEAKNPLQQAVKDAQSALQKEISEIEARIEASVLDVANRTLEKLREMAPELAKQLTPKFKDRPKWTFNFTLEGEDGIPINKRGSGVRRLILLNFFRAEAERSTSGTTSTVIYGIEEPETSQHPNFQTMLMKALLDLSNKADRQVIVTTHVPALAGLIPVEGVRYVTRNDEGTPVVRMPADGVLKEAADSLGVLPEIGLERAKGIVLVEGKSDITFLKHAARQMKAHGYIDCDLDDKRIVPILVGGCGSVKHWVTLRLADELKLPWCVFLDSDIGGDPSQVKANQKRRQEVEALNRKFYSTRKREIENYLCPDLIYEETGIQVQFGDTDDAKKIVANALRMDPDNVSDRFWPSMCAERIRSRAAYLDEGHRRCELEELLKGILSLTDEAA